MCFFRFSKTSFSRQNNNFRHHLRPVSLANCLSSLHPNWLTLQPAVQSVHLSHLCCNRSLSLSSPQFQVNPLFWYCVRLFNIDYRLFFRFYSGGVYIPGSNDTQVFPGTSGPSGVTVNQGKPPLNLAQSVQV